eukprot:5996535-Amphidinium_carterae.2
MKSNAVLLFGASLRCCGRRHWVNVTTITLSIADLRTLADLLEPPPGCACGWPSLRTSVKNESDLLSTPLWTWQGHMKQQNAGSESQDLSLVKGGYDALLNLDNDVARSSSFV